MTDSDAKTSSVSDNVSAFVLTVTADENNVTSTGGGHTDTCPAFSTCSFAYLGGTALSIKTAAKNLVDCEQFIRWDGACSGQSNTCSLVINSDISTTAVFGPLLGCIPK